MTLIKQTCWGIAVILIISSCAFRSTSYRFNRLGEDLKNRALAISDSILSDQLKDVNIIDKLKFQNKLSYATNRELSYSNEKGYSRNRDFSMFYEYVYEKTTIASIRVDFDQKGQLDESSRSSFDKKVSLIKAVENKKLFLQSDSIKNIYKIQKLGRLLYCRIIIDESQPYWIAIGKNKQGIKIAANDLSSVKRLSSDDIMAIIGL